MLIFVYTCIVLVSHCSPVDYLSSQPSSFLVVMALTGLSCHTLLIFVITPVALKVDTSSLSIINVSNTLNGNVAPV